VDPLPILNHFGKTLNVILGDGEPFRHGDFTTHQIL
jgi:hypothetical protein